MKLQINFNEVLSMLADKHNVSVQNIEVLSETCAEQRVYPRSTENQLRELLNYCEFSNKLAVIKIVREMTGLGLKESKDLVDESLGRKVEGYDRLVGTHRVQ